MSQRPKRNARRPERLRKSGDNVLLPQNASTETEAVPENSLSSNVAILPQLTETIVVHEDIALGSTGTQTCGVEPRNSPASQINSGMQWGNHNGLDEIKAVIKKCLFESCVLEKQYFPYAKKCHR